MVKASTLRVEDPGFESRLRQIFPGSSHTSDFKTGTPVATLPGTWHYRVSAGTVVWCAASTSVWQHVKFSEQIRPWDTLACCWDVKQPTNKQTVWRGGGCNKGREKGWRGSFNAFSCLCQIFLFNCLITEKNYWMHMWFHQWVYCIVNHTSAVRYVKIIRIVGYWLTAYCCFMI